MFREEAGLPAGFLPAGFEKRYAGGFVLISLDAASRFC